MAKTSKGTRQRPNPAGMRTSCKSSCTGVQTWWQIAGTGGVSDAPILGSPLGGSRQQFCGKVVTDMHVGFMVFQQTELAVGAQNLLNAAPDQNHVGQARNGRLEDSSGSAIVESPEVFFFSRRSAPFGLNGGSYYARFSVKF